MENSLDADMERLWRLLIWSRFDKARTTSSQSHIATSFMTNVEKVCIVWAQDLAANIKCGRGMIHAYQYFLLKMNPTVNIL